MRLNYPQTSVDKSQKFASTAISEQRRGKTKVVDKKGVGLGCSGNGPHGRVCLWITTTGELPLFSSTNYVFPLISYG